jgi:hypothetical protein
MRGFPGLKRGSETGTSALVTLMVSRGVEIIPKTQAPDSLTLQGVFCHEGFGPQLPIESGPGKRSAY